MTGRPTVEYDPSPTLARFHASNAFVRGVMGPIGSGKSVGCCWEIWTRATEQMPGPDGVRRSRWVATRNTYGELTTTTIKTWLDWFPEDRFGPVVYSAPIEHVLRWTGDDGIAIELEMWFLALDRPEHIKKLLSLEITGAWMNEAREQPKAILDGLSGRVGRYPSARNGGATWSGLIADTNPPDEDHWWYRLAEETMPEGFAFFSQPAGDSEEGENLDWLNQTPETLKLPVGDRERRAQGRLYYQRLSAGKTEEWVRVYVKGQYGSIHDGKPVYPEWNHLLHKRAIRPLQGVPLDIGFDFGLSPAAVITQVDPRGRLLVLDEVIGEDMAIRQLLQDLLIPQLTKVYPAWWAKRNAPNAPMIRCFGDPAGDQRAQTDERTCFDEIRAAGLKIRPARTNAFLARRGAVAWFLSKLTGGQPAMVVDPCCTVLVKGFNGGYKYRRLKVSGDERYTEEPVKNRFSHCFVAGTPVATPDGERRIEELVVGDRVVTPWGDRRITATMSRDDVGTLRMEFSNGRALECTTDHPFIVGETAVRADELQYSDVLHCIGQSRWEGQPSTPLGSSGECAFTGSRPATTRRTTAGTCIAWCGRRITALFRPATTSIIGTRTRATMTRATWNACLGLNTSHGTTWTPSGLLHLPGTGPTRDARGTASTAKPPGPAVERAPFAAAIAAARSRLLSACRSGVSVLRRARPLPAARAASMTSSASVPSVPALSWSTGTAAPERAARLVGRSRSVARARVYDLTVEGAHCFYAAGILVSNCHDALQYVALESGGVQAMKAPDPVPRIPPPHVGADSTTGVLG